LMVYDKKGIVRASIGIDQKSDDSGAAALDHNGVLRAASVAVETARAKGTSGNFVYDKDGLLRGGVDVDLTNNFIGFFNLDTNGKARIVAGSPIVAGVEFVDLFDGNSILRVGLAADYDSTGGTGLNMFDKGAF